MYCRFCGKRTCENATVCDECVRNGRTLASRQVPRAEERVYDETYSLLPALLSLVGGIVANLALSFYLIIFLVFLITLIAEAANHTIIVQFIAITVTSCVIMVLSFISGIVALIRRNGTAKKYGSHRSATIALSIIGIIISSFCIYYLIISGVILQSYYMTL